MPKVGSKHPFRGQRIAASPLAIIVLVLFSCPSITHASPLLELLGSGLGTGGLNARAGGASAASAYFNPALLPRSQPGLEVGVMLLNDAISLTLDARDPAVDVPVANLRSARQIYPVPTRWLQEGCMRGSDGMCSTNLESQPRQSEGSSGTTRVYQLIGLVSHLIKDRWAIGLYTLMPFGSLLTAHSFFADEREQYFTNSLHPELYSDRLTPMTLALGNGLRIFDWLSAGVSFTLNLSNTAQGNSFVGQASNLEKTLQLSTRAKSSLGIAPHFALLIEPIKPLDISFTIHTVQQLEIVADAGTYIGTGDKQVAKRTAVHDWTPLTLALGGTYELYQSEPHGIVVTGTVLYKQWSQYLNREGERPLPGYEWADTISGAVGARYSYASRVDVYLDANYDPSPVPLQTGRTNYVDNDRFGIAAGLNYVLPVSDWGVKFRFGAQAQLHVLRARHQSKIDPRSKPNNTTLVIDEWPDSTAINPITQEPFAEAVGLQTNNPGWPGFSSSGTILSALLSVGLMY